MSRPYHCPDSVTGHGDPDRNGLCPWCKRKIGAKSPPPPPQRGVSSELDDSYRLHWDPDYDG